MSAWLRRDKARACPIHTAIMDEAAKRLYHSGDFSKDEVLDALNLGAVADAIRWDYIREFLEDEQKCELVPLASAYFKRHKKLEEMTNPAKYLATGYGKKTAGFAAVVPHNDHLVVKRVKQRKAMANGVGLAFLEYLQAVEAKRGATVLEDKAESKAITASV